MTVDYGPVPGQLVMDLYKDSWLWTCTRTDGFGPVPGQLIMDLYQLDSWLWTCTSTVVYGPVPGLVCLQIHTLCAVNTSLGTIWQ